MPFKRQASTLQRVSNLIENLPRRATGRPPIPRNFDPEICGPLYEGYIDIAFSQATVRRSTDLQIMGAECRKLGLCLSGKTVSSLYITCANCIGNRYSSSNAAQNSLQLCLSEYGTYLNQASATSLLFRELVRLCGGKELDAWALDYYFRTETPPSIIKDSMCAGSTPFGTGSTLDRSIRVGAFVIWFSGSGSLYVKEIKPDGSVGSFGISLTGSMYPGWQHVCP
jgi:hypothetical protein